MARATSELLDQLRVEGSDPDLAMKIAVVIPCYRERAHILRVLEQVPPEVEQIICIDDACPDGTGKLVEAQSNDPRVSVLYNTQNLGVGGATLRGYEAALAGDVTVVVKIDGDGQMDPSLLSTIVEPIRNGDADYAKGNRFFDLENLQSMPAVRLIGNAVLSFVSKFSTGYWQMFDPTNGFTAIHRDVLALLPLNKIDHGYFFESDMLFRLNTLRCVVVDVPMSAHYGDERSHLNVAKELASFVYKNSANFAKRVFYNYFLRGFSLASIQWIVGPMLLLFGVWFGLTEWIAGSSSGETATAGTVMLAALPTIVGIQFILAAIEYDIRNVPTIPLHRLLRPRVD